LERAPSPSILKSSLITPIIPIEKSHHLYQLVPSISSPFHTQCRLWVLGGLRTGYLWFALLAAAHCHRLGDFLPCIFVKFVLAEDGALAGLNFAEVEDELGEFTARMDILSDDFVVGNVLVEEIFIKGSLIFSFRLLFVDDEFEASIHEVSQIPLVSHDVGMGSILVEQLLLEFSRS
jgi:hypothetical protein